MDRDWMSRSAVSLLVRGVVGVVFGILAMVWPRSTALALIILWGCWALADGVISLGTAFTSRGAGGRVGLVLLGLLSLVVAFFAITSPGVTAAALTWVLGIWLVVRGVFELVGAFSAGTSANRWVLVAIGLLDGLIGVLLMANPGRAALGIAFLIGLLAFVWGLVFLGLAFVVWRAGKGQVPGTPSSATI